jgi:nucleoside-diphosphate-sugar epimerase
VLVTGAGGFIGSHLAADQAQRGNSVVALDLHLDRVRHLERRGAFELLEGDVADPALQRRALEGVDVVFHLAAAHLSVSAPAAEFERVNVEAVRSLTELAAATGVRRFVHCSSVGVYGTLREVPATEETPCHPEIAYEKTKLLGEQVVGEAMRRGLSAAIVRPVWVYGPGCPRTEKLFRAVGKGRFFIAGDGAARRHCIYIRDMVRAFEAAATAESAPGHTVIVGERESVTVAELLHEIARLTGARPPRSVPVWALSAAGLAAELVCGVLRREPPISRRTLKFFTSNTAFDVSLARHVLEFEPRYDLAAGLRETHGILHDETAPRVPLPQPVAR